MVEKEKLTQLHSRWNDYNLPFSFAELTPFRISFQGVMNTMFPFIPKALPWAEITFDLQPISEKVNIHALKAQYNSTQWQRLGVEVQTKQNYALKAQYNSTQWQRLGKHKNNS